MQDCSIFLALGKKDILAGVTLTKLQHPIKLQQKICGMPTPDFYRICVISPLQEHLKLQRIA